MLLDLPSSSEPLAERMRLIRFRMKKEHPRFADELRLVPRALVIVLAALFLIAELAAFLICTLNLVPNGEVIEPVERYGVQWGTAAVCGMVAAAAIPLACVLMLIGYVSRDAARRGMNAMLWTLFVIILLPAFLLTGFIIYFLVREPLPYYCPKCGALVTARYNFCPACKYLLHPTCPQCKHEVGEHDRYCAQCGFDIA